MDAQDESVSVNSTAIYPSMHLLSNPEKGKHTAFIQLGLTYRQLSHAIT